MSERLSILIADDHPIFRSGLRGIIGEDRLLHVAGVALITMAKARQAGH